METCQSPDITELAKAMLKVQTALQPAMKDAENPFTKSKYATLNSVMGACRDTLISNGIWLCQYPVPAEAGHMGLVTKLTHTESGQWQSSLMVMPLAKTDPQGYGSALTYARRYSLAALVGLVTEDDDAESACGRKARKRLNGKNPMDGEPGDTLPAEAEPKSGEDSELTQEILKKLPKLDGINYQAIRASDGQLCVIATGHTAAKKEILSSTGFRWNQERKIWWKYAA